MIKIAISGKKRSGKNTLSTLLTGNFKPTLKNDEYKISSIASKLKIITSLFFPEANDECLYGVSELRENQIAGEKYKNENNEPLTYRDALKSLGKLGRNFNSDLWINHTITEYLENKDKKLFIITDLRMENEYNKLKEHNFYFIRIKRDTGLSDKDISETGLDLFTDDKFDYIVNNNSNIENLNKQSMEILKTLGINKQ